jgi:hypothetical protein
VVEVERVDEVFILRRLDVVGLMQHVDDHDAPELDLAVQQNAVICLMERPLSLVVFGMAAVREA